MRNIKEEVEQFFKILYRECPDIMGRIAYDLTVAFNPVPVYDLEIVFPSEFRDQVYTLSKFCGLVFTHETISPRENVSTFQSEAQFF